MSAVTVRATSPSHVGAPYGHAPAGYGAADTVTVSYSPQQTVSSSPGVSVVETTLPLVSEATFTTVNDALPTEE